jgi:hypothetical protein
MSNANEILSEAQRLAEKSETWADLSNALFDPMDGLVAKCFPDPVGRAAFRKSEEYGKLHALVEQKMQRTGVAAGAEPTKSGKFVVRLPRTMHAALEREAISEGTSLNQLVLAKLAARMSTLTSGGTASLIQAYVEVRGEAKDKPSTDLVVADPELDRKFLRRCRELGLAGTDYDLNWKLLNARKNSLLSEVPQAKRFSVKNPDEFEYASELAVRHLQRTKNVSLDQIICDPELAQEFDDFAKLLAPDKHSPLEYRWVALGLRKAGKLPRGKAADVGPPSLTHLSSIATSLLPKTGGLYLFSIGEQPVFLSQTDNIRQRIERHMDVSHSRGLPEWLWDRGPLELSIAEMPGVVRTARESAEMSLVQQLHPVLNFQRVAA